MANKPNGTLYIDAPEKRDPGMKDSVDSRKEPSVDHCDAQWIPAFAGMTKKDHSPRSHGFPPSLEWQRKITHHVVMGSRRSRKTFPVIPAKAGIHKDAPVMKHPRSTL